GHIARGAQVCPLLRCVVPERGWAVKRILLFFLPRLPQRGTYTLRRSPRGFFFESPHPEALGVDLPRLIDKLVGRMLMVCSSSPVAVVLFLATAPQVIPS